MSTTTLLQSTTTTTILVDNNSETHHPNDIHTQTDNSAGGVVIFGLMVTILFGALMERSKSKNPVPFSITMIAYGMIIGIIAHSDKDLESKLLMADMYPLDTLNIFLPILIFDGAYNLKLSTLQKVSFASVLLAGPGVLLNAFSMGAIAGAIYPTWSFAQKLMFGGIVSATDPVSVIATLKDLDADRWTTTLTDGEAIMNDGTAVVLYEMLRKAVTRFAEEPSAGEVIVSILRYVFLPIPVGLILGAIVGYCEKRSPTKPIVVTAVQLAGAYTAYYLAADVIETSTVLTLMFMALYMSAQRAQFPKGDYDHGVKHFWEILVWMANCLLFALIGLVSVIHVWRRINAVELPHILLMYLALNGTRGAMLLLAWPIINYGVKREDERMNWRRWAMLTYGGLRGGIALLLGLAVLQERHNDPTYAHPLFAQCAGIVLLTSVINGWTAGPVVAWLGLDAKAAFSHHAILQAVEEIRATAEVRLQDKKNKEDDVFFIDWAFVYANTVTQIVPPTNRAYSYAPLMTRSSQHGGDGDELSLDSSSLYADGSGDEPLTDMSSTSAAENNRVVSDGTEEGDYRQMQHERETPLVLTSRGKDRGSLMYSDDDDDDDGIETGESGSSLARDKKKRKKRSSSRKIRQIIAQVQNSPNSDVLIPIVLRVMKREMWRMYDSALLAGRTISVLENFFETMSTDKKLFTADDLLEYLAHPDRFNQMQHKIKAFVSSLKEDKAELIVSGVTAFARIMRTIYHTVTVLYGSMSNIGGWMEWAKITLKDAEELSLQVRIEYPFIARQIDSRRVAQEIMSEAQENVESISLMTGLTGKQRDWLKSKIFRIIFNVSHESPPDWLSDNELVEKVFVDSVVAAACTSEERDRLWSVKTLKHCKQGEAVPLLPNEFGIVISGRVLRKDSFTHKPLPHVSTDVFGLSACVRRMNRSIVFTAESTTVVILTLPFVVLQDIMKTNSSVRDAVFRNEALIVTEPLLSQVYPSCALSPFQRKVLAEHAELVYFSEGAHHSLMSPKAHHSGTNIAINALSSASPISTSATSTTDFSENKSSASSSTTQQIDKVVLTRNIPTENKWGSNRTTFLLRGSSPELPGPHALTLLPETFYTNWDTDETVLLVLHDIKLTQRNVPITGIFFMDRAHVHIDVMLTSFAQSNEEMLLFTLDRLIYALTEYVPCLFALHSLFERSGLNMNHVEETEISSSSQKNPFKLSLSNNNKKQENKISPAQVVEKQLELIENVAQWMFLRHTGGIVVSEIVNVLEEYFEKVIRTGDKWSKDLVSWGKQNAEKVSSPLSSPKAKNKLAGGPSVVGGLGVVESPKSSSTSPEKKGDSASAASASSSATTPSPSSSQLLSYRWAESCYEACDVEIIEQMAKKLGYRFPIRRSKLVSQGVELRLAASTFETVFEN